MPKQCHSCRVDKGKSAFKVTQWTGLTPTCRACIENKVVGGAGASTAVFAMIYKLPIPTTIPAHAAPHPSAEYTQCLAYLKQGAALVVAVFVSWFGARKEGEWLREKGDFHGDTPLHLAVINKVPEAVALMLLAAWPDGAKELDNKGNALLHLALKKYNASETVVMALFAAWPGVVYCKDKLRNTPLHLALKYSATETVVMALFAAWLGAVKEKDNLGDTPLYLALWCSAPEAVTMALLAAWPDAVKEKDSEKMLPLHIALKKKAPEAVTMALLAAWPGAVNKKDREKNAPLHIALEKKAPEAVVVALLAAWPDVTIQKNNEGSIPLHLALVNKYPEAVVLTMHAAWPYSAKMRDNRNNAPLHLALKYSATESVVMALFAAWPGAVKEKDNLGDTPLYLALWWSAPEAVTMALLAAWPDAVKEKDSEKMLPLHIALEKKAPEAVVLALLAAWPGAARLHGRGKSNRGTTALQFATKFHASDAVVRALVASFQDAVKEVTKTYAVPYTNQATGGDSILHTLATAECSSVAESRNTNTVFFTLVKNGASLTATNAKGQTPVEASQAEEVPHTSTIFGFMVQRKKVNHHLIANFCEIAWYKKLKHLSLMHFRDWTTVSHAWCTPSAKLVALTVLLVGETYKRRLLPRLPMDCWYFILKCIPRHELRQGGCEPDEEQVARAIYVSILAPARLAIKRERVAAEVALEAEHAARE